MTTLLLFFLMEGALRIWGQKPFKEQEKAAISIEGCSSFFREDSILGYRHVEGNFKIGLKNKYTFSTTHNARSLRSTIVCTPTASQ